MLDLPIATVTFLFDRPGSLLDPEDHFLLDAALTIAPKEPEPLGRSIRRDQDQRGYEW